MEMLPAVVTWGHTLMLWTAPLKPWVEQLIQTTGQKKAEMCFSKDHLWAVGPRKVAISAGEATQHVLSRRLPLLSCSKL